MTKYYRGRTFAPSFFRVQDDNTVEFFGFDQKIESAPTTTPGWLARERDEIKREDVPEKFRLPEPGVVKHPITYRGIEVPAKHLHGLMSASTLAAWKDGVDSGLEHSGAFGVVTQIPAFTPGPKYVYFRDNDVIRADEFFYRFPVGGGPGQKRHGLHSDWVETEDTEYQVRRRSHRYTEAKPEQLPSQVLGD